MNSSKPITFGGNIEAPCIMKQIYKRFDNANYIHYSAEKMWEASANLINFDELTSVALHWLDDTQHEFFDRDELSTFLWLVVNKDLIHGQKYMADYNVNQDQAFIININLKNEYIFIATSVDSYYRSSNSKAKIKKIKPIKNYISPGDTPANTTVSNNEITKLRELYTENTNAQYLRIPTNEDKMTYEPKINQYSFALQNWLNNTFIQAYYLIRTYPHVLASIKKFAYHVHYKPSNGSFEYPAQSFPDETDFNIIEMNGSHWYPEGYDEEKQAVIDFFNFNF